MRPHVQQLLAPPLDDVGGEAESESEDFEAEDDSIMRLTLKSDVGSLLCDTLWPLSRNVTLDHIG